MLFGDCVPEGVEVDSFMAIMCLGQYGHYLGARLDERFVLGWCAHPSRSSSEISGGCKWLG